MQVVRAALPLVCLLLLLGLLLLRCFVSGGAACLVRGCVGVWCACV